MRDRPAMTLGVCVICGEHVTTHDELGEMHDPAKFDPEFTEEERMVVQEADPANSGLVHAQCGLDKGWEIS